MTKVEYKKTFKDLYMPKAMPSIIEVPRINFALLEGEGDPNGEEFALATEALYSFSYAVKMSYKGSNVPQGYYDYTVFPLEGEWDLVDKDIAVTNKDNYKYTIMIRQPDFLTTELFERFLRDTKAKKTNSKLDMLKFQTIEEGLCCQMLHIGSYDEETVSFNLMEEFCHKNNYRRALKTHREIYLTDPRKTVADKLKTVLRFKCERL